MGLMHSLSLIFNGARKGEEKNLLISGYVHVKKRREREKEKECEAHLPRAFRPNRPDPSRTDPDRHSSHRHPTTNSDCKMEAQLAYVR